MGLFDFRDKKKSKEVIQIKAGLELPPPPSLEELKPMNFLLPQESMVDSGSPLKSKEDVFKNFEKKDLKAPEAPPALPRPKAAMPTPPMLSQPKIPIPAPPVIKPDMSPHKEPKIEKKTDKLEAKKDVTSSKMPSIPSLFNSFRTRIKPTVKKPEIKESAFMSKKVETAVKPDVSEKKKELPKLGPPPKVETLQEPSKFSLPKDKIEMPDFEKAQEKKENFSFTLPEFKKNSEPVRIQPPSTIIKEMESKPELPIPEFKREIQRKTIRRPQEPMRPKITVSNHAFTGFRKYPEPLSFPKTRAREIFMRADSFGDIVNLIEETNKILSSRKAININKLKSDQDPLLQKWSLITKDVHTKLKEVEKELFG